MTHYSVVTVNFIVIEDSEKEEKICQHTSDTIRNGKPFHNLCHRLLTAMNSDSYSTISSSSYKNSDSVNIMWALKAEKTNAELCGEKISKNGKSKLWITF
ncbi:CLUMA_CG008540, isoform A [Clunio marinus]|uniref:CLUMA_CG008540, isoform A n=1 Tax=Clunio marinus TaxID=568069 RepID=A0A1J1I9E9_9DIPT|nr:CLUMA_CG008540, isoform A [Clunio marinus]